MLAFLPVNPHEKSPLTRTQTRWLSEILNASVPGEQRATCDDCAMCNHVAPDASSFNPDTKCCTYIPRLPNFLVGQMLADESPAGAEGRASIRARIAAGSGVTPIGLSHPRGNELKVRRIYERSFGQNLALRCPHYVEAGGICGIWQHRNAVCATWFCKHSRGKKGSDFWERVRDFLSLIERALARSLVLDLDIGTSALARLYAAPSRAGDRAALFGNWAGREQDFYRASAEIVAGLDLDAILARCGAEARTRIELLREAWKNLRSTELPKKLRVGQLTVVRMDAATCRVATYNDFDPLEMPSALFDALPVFDGRSAHEAIRAIEHAGGPRISKSLVRKLIDFDVLTPSDES